MGIPGERVSARESGRSTGDPSPSYGSEEEDKKEKSGDCLVCTEDGELLDLETALEEFGVAWERIRTAVMLGSTGHRTPPRPDGTTAGWKTGSHRSHPPSHRGPASCHLCSLPEAYRLGPRPRPQTSALSLSPSPLTTRLPGDLLLLWKIPGRQRPLSTNLPSGLPSHTAGSTPIRGPTVILLPRGEPRWYSRVTHEPPQRRP